MSESPVEWGQTCPHCGADLELSTKAAERVALERVAATLEARAGLLFAQGKDALASEVRNLAREVRGFADQASNEQGQMLRKRGIR